MHFIHQAYCFIGIIIFKHLASCRIACWQHRCGFYLLSLNCVSVCVREREGEMWGNIHCLATCTFSVNFPSAVSERILTWTSCNLDTFLTNCAELKFDISLYSTLDNSSHCFMKREECVYISNSSNKYWTMGAIYCHGENINEWVD